MKRKIKQVMSLFLALSLLFTYSFQISVNAQEQVLSQETTEVMEQPQPDEEITPTNENIEEEQSSSGTDLNESEADIEEEVTEDIEEQNSAVLPGDSSLVEYFYVGSPYLQTPAAQQFVLSFKNEINGIQKVQVQYQKDGGAEISLDFSNHQNGLYVFNKTFSESESGSYKVTGFTYVVGEQEYKVNFSDLQMDIRFGVNQEYDGYGTAEGYSIDANGNEVTQEEQIDTQGLTASEIDASVISVDGIDTAQTESMVQEVLQNQAAVSTQSKARSNSARAYTPSNPLIICIDPGHGGNDSGTGILNGLWEKNVNLKIAQYLKAELERYSGVKIVMTRTGDTNPSLKERAQIAADAGAVALVSLHINATGWGTQSSISGAEVYYPNTNYNASVSETGKNLAQKILNELTGIGINSLGIKVKYVYDDVTGLPTNDPVYDYPDGSVGDYYGVIRHSKELGVAGIIVEHCMSDNWHDVNNFLSSDAQLKKMGIADATGIAKAFGLQIDKYYGTQVVHKNDFKGTFDIQVKTIANKDVSLKIWANDKGEASAKTYKATYTNNGVYQYSYNINEQNRTYGTYTIETYIDGEYKDTITCKMSNSSAELMIANQNNKDTNFVPSLTIKNVPDGIKNISFAVWSANNGQDDLVWYTGTKATSNGWMANIDLNKHKDFGTYNVHAYVVMSDGYNIFADSGTFTIEKPSGKVSIANKDDVNGSFDVVVSDINCKSGVNQMQAAVWSDKNGQDDWSKSDAGSSVER